MPYSQDQINFYCVHLHVCTKILLLKQEINLNHYHVHVYICIYLGR
jgi:hypothetical protein